jgi:hypothetical protein
VRNAVVLVSETVAEAFRDAKQGGGLKSAFACLRAEGLEGNHICRRMLAISLLSSYHSKIISNMGIISPYMKIPLFEPLHRYGWGTLMQYKKRNLARCPHN